MNKIFNWTVGSFFRSIGRILAYLFIGMILSFIFMSNKKLLNLLGIDYVYAATNANWSSTLLEVQQCEQSCNVHGLNCSLTNCINDSTDKRGTEGRLTFGSTNGHLKKLQLQVFAGSNVFPAGNYTFNSTVAIDPKVIEELKTNYNILIYGNTSSSSSGASTGNNYFNGKSCSIENESGTYDFTLNCVFNTNVNLKYFNFSLENNGNGEPLTNSNALYWRSFNTFSYTADPTGAINNQTTIIENNFNDLNDNLNNNTNTIIDNQNANSQAQIESQQVCEKKVLNFNDDVSQRNAYLSLDGNYITSQYWGVTDYIKIKNVKVLKIAPYNAIYSCFYDENKILVSCKSVDTSNLNLENNVVYARFSIRNTDIPEYEIETCKNGNQALQDTLTDDDVNSSTNEASDFFEDFTTDTHGLTGIITAPLNAINSLTSATCSPLVLPLPYVNQDLTLPCMRTIYESNFGDFMILYDVITLGIISYWVSIRIFNLVKDFKNPEHDEIEVMDL